MEENITNDTLKVVIIGAGVSGLNAARSLVNCKWKDKKVEVIILEARDRVGGRVLSKKLIPKGEKYEFEEDKEQDHSNTLNKRRKLEKDNYWVDLGASFIHGCNKMNIVYDLLVKRNDVKIDGRNGGYSSGWGESSHWYDCENQGKLVDKSELERAWRISWRVYDSISKLSTQYMKDKTPDISIEKAIELVMPKVLSRYKNKVLSEKFQQVFSCIKVLFWGYTTTCDKVSISVQYQEPEEDLVKLNSSEVNEEILQQISIAETSMDEDKDDNNGDAIILEGYKQLIDILLYGGIKERFKDEKQINITFNKVVNKIHQDANTNKVTVFCEDGTQHICDEVIVTIPVGCLKANKIVFEPPLSLAKQTLINNVGMGAENKIILKFKEPFWPKESYIQTTDERFRFLNLDTFGKSGIIVAHTQPPYSLTLGVTPDEQILQDVVSVLISVSSKPNLDLQQILNDNLQFHHITKWHLDPFSMGSYSFLAVNTTLDDILEFSNPEGSISFAGEACSIFNMQCVQGAFQSGREAATKIIDKHNKSLQICLCGDVSQEQMIECDHCFQWYHAKCLNLKDLGNFLWYCDDCEKQKEIVLLN